MRKLESLLLIPAFIFTLSNCDPYEEEDSYYEPIIEGTFEYEVDKDQLIKFTLEPLNSAIVEGEFENGIHFKIEFPEGTLRSNQRVDCEISPITNISGLPSEFNFQFGFSFSPGGTYFMNPPKMTLELPEDFEIKDFKGFFFDGDDPSQTDMFQIWDINMTPVLFETIDGKVNAIVEIPHFSGFAGLLSDNFKCGNPKSADYCIELQEIIACYISGKESLEKDDLDQVNKALRDWMDSGLNRMEENPTELDEEWEFLNASEELIRWKATALQFNNDLQKFEDLLQRASNVLSNSIIQKIIDENTLCTEYNDAVDQAGSFELNYSLITLFHELEASGFLDGSLDINLLNFCDGIGVKYLTGLFIDDTEQYISKRHDDYDFNLSHQMDFNLIFPPKLSPAVARSVDLIVYGRNLIGDEFEIVLGKDYNIVDYHPELDNGYIINGSNISEKIYSCYDQDSKTYFPCYHRTGGSLDIRLLHGSKNGITLYISRPN